MIDLRICREQLDEVDAMIVALYERRIEICGKVAESKIASGKAVYDSQREQEKLKAVSALTQGDFNKTAVREIFSQLMTLSRRYQYQLMLEHGLGLELGFEKIKSIPTEGVKVVYQGAEGAYQHAAALQFFGQDADVYHVSTFGDAMKEVEEGKADFAVLPIENSSAGAVVDTYDLLVNCSNYIVAQIFLPVSHALLAGEGTNLSQIRTVYSHPQALMQCSTYLNKQRDWKQVSMANTAVAARKVLEDQDHTQAAIASEIAGKIYGLKVLKPAIQNVKGNTTRFVVLSKKPIYTEAAEKISLCFELPHQSGTLYNVLGHFIFNHINMIMIESRPIPGKNWEYRFFVDIEGNLEDAAVKNALKGIEEEASNMRILGNY